MNTLNKDTVKLTGYKRAKTIAKYLDVSEGTIRNMVLKGELTKINVHARTVVFCMDEVHNLMKTKECKM